MKTTNNADLVIFDPDDAIFLDIRLFQWGRSHFNDQGFAGWR